MPEHSEIVLVLTKIASNIYCLLLFFYDKTKLDITNVIG